MRSRMNAASAPWLHAEVGRRMAERLPIIRHPPQRWLDWWAHVGGSAAAVRAAYPQAQRIAVEADEAARVRSSERLPPWWSRRRWGPQAEAVVLQNAVDPAAAEMVWANMMLHAVADPPALFARWQQALAVDGFVMFSCLGPGTLRELRALYAQRGWPAPTPNFVDMHDLGDMLVQAGFADPVMDQETITLSWPDPAALLRELRSLGGNTAPQRHAGLRTPRWRTRLEHALAALAGPDGKPSLGFEIAYGHAFRAAPRPKVGAATSVSLDEMRSMVRSGRVGP